MGYIPFRNVPSKIDARLEGRIKKAGRSYRSAGFFEGWDRIVMLFHAPAMYIMDRA
jgi:hypothetical protein